MYRMLCRCCLRHNCRRYNYQTKRNTQNFSFHYSLNLITRQSNGDMLDPAMYYSAYILYFCTIILYNSLYILRNNVFLYARPDFYIWNSIKAYATRRWRETLRNMARKGFVWHTCLSGQNRCSMSLFMLEWGNGNRNQFTNLSFR